MINQKIYVDTTHTHFLLVMLQNTLHQHQHDTTTFSSSDLQNTLHQHQHQHHATTFSSSDFTKYIASTYRLDFFVCLEIFII